MEMLQTCVYVVTAALRPLARIVEVYLQELFTIHITLHQVANPSVKAIFYFHSDHSVVTVT